MSRVLISAAHTQLSPGEIHGDLREVDLTKKIVEKMLPHLQKLNIEHKMVPLDMMLFNRIDWINDTGYTEALGDIFIEIHINDGGDRGVEGWYEGKDEADNKSKELTDFLLKEVCAKSGYKSQGAHSESEHPFGSLIVLNQTNTISTAFECFFIDNEEDIKILKDDIKLDEFCKHFAESIKKYIDSDIAKKPGKKKTVTPTLNFPGSNPMGAGNPMFGGSNTFGGGTPAAGSTQNSTSNAMMSREDRKKMIETTYQKLLGKDVNQADLNHLLNIAISEEQLHKKILDSKDHEQLVTDAQEFKKLKEESTKTEAELARLKGENNDLLAMHEAQNRLLHHKNAYIAKIQSELIKHGIIKPGEHLDYGKPDQYLPK